MLDTSWFEKFVLRVVAILLMVMIVVSIGWLIFLFGVNTWDRVGEVKDVLQLQEAVQKGLGGIFVILLGLELLETVKSYAAHRRFRLEVVLVVGAIAVARHVIQLDFHHVDGLFLGGLGVLIASLVVGYYVLQLIPEDRGGSLRAALTSSLPKE